MSRGDVAQSAGRFKRVVVVVAAGLVLAAGLLVGGMRLFDHFAPTYRQALANRIGQRIGAQVHFTDLSLGWSWHGPVLYLDHVRFTRTGADAPALTARRIGLEFSIGELLTGARLPDGLTLDGAHATLVVGPHGLHLAHGPGPGRGGLNWSQVAGIRRQLSRIVLRHAALTIRSPRLPHGKLRWSNVQFHWKTGPKQHLSVRLSTDGPAWWPHLSARASLHGPLDKPSDLEFDLRADGLEPLAIANGSNAGVPPGLSGGTMGLTVHGRWANGRLDATRIALDSRALVEKGHDKPLVPALEAQFEASSATDKPEINLKLTQLTGGPTDADSLGLHAAFNTRTHAATAAAKTLPGPLMTRIARLVSPRLEQTDIRGAFDGLSVRWQPGKPLNTRLGFHDLTVSNPHVSLGPLAGRYTEHGGQHTLQFARAGGQLKAPGYLRSALDVTGLTGRVQWHRQSGGARVFSLDHLQLASRKAHLTASGRVTEPASGGAPTVDLTADAHAPDLPRLFAKIPQRAGLPNPRLRAWLPKAIKAGSLDSGHLTVKGPMNRFPFPEAGPNAGFHMTLEGHGLDVRYKPGWPMLTDARGTLHLDGDRFQLALPAGRVLGVDLAGAQADIPDVRQPILKLTARGTKLPARKMLAFIGQSPLRKRFGTLVKALRVQGPDDLDLKLRLPLKPGLGGLKVDGRITPHDNEMSQSALPAPIKHINGQLTFSTHGVRAHGLQGTLLGVPLTADLTPASDGGEQITAHAQPALPDDRAALAHYIPNPWLVYGHGRAPVTVGFTVGAQGGVSPIRITSPLTGMALNLPAPMHKAAAAKAPLAVTVQASNGRIQAEYDHRLQLHIRLGANDRPQRIQALLGHTGIRPPDINGLWVGGHAKTVDGLGWFHVVRHILYAVPAVLPGTKAAGSGTSAAPSAAYSDALAFQGGDITVDRLNFGDRYVAHPHIRADPMSGVPGWRVNFEGADSQGQITWTDRSGQPMHIAGNLRRVALKTSKPSKSPPSQSQSKSGSGGPSTRSSSASPSSVIWPDVSPRYLPALKLYVAHFVVDGTDFGQLHADARDTPDGWSLSRFKLADGALTGTASAHWQQDGQRSSARARVNFEGHGLSRLLRSFGYNPPIRARKARLNADLSIAPNSKGLDLHALNGQVRFGLDHGTLLNVDPGDTARILGLFNVFVLPRRLRLDFRDVVDKGMAFDKVRAHFDIDHGQAYTKSTRIEAPSAEIRMHGRIGLATRDYDEKITVSPKFGTGMAIAGTVLGGPIVGAAVLAAQELLKVPIQHFSSLTYTLKGSWDNPKIGNASAKTN